MFRFFYSLCFRLLLPFILLRLWWRSGRVPGNPVGWRQRLGFVPRLSRSVVWVHAVSVGETMAAGPLVKALLRRSPELCILVTAMTATGAERARALFGDQVLYAFCPYDTPGSVRRFVERVNPRALIIMETEIWPNLIAENRLLQVPVFLVNARLSKRSARGYQRVGKLIRPVVNDISWIAAQAEEDARRFVHIGARSSAVSVTGNIKFGVEIADEMILEARRTRSQFGGDRPIWIAASTHSGEEQDVLDAHRCLLAAHPDALLIIVPRHPERFSAVASLIVENEFHLARRSRGDSVNEAQVYLGDTMGELLMLYGVSDMGFVGGSLIERGGHNPLEPAAWGIPVITGPHVFNFEMVYRRLDDGQALSVVTSADELASCIQGLMADPGRAKLAGENALSVVGANRGALERVVTGITQRIAGTTDTP